LGEENFFFFQYWPSDLSDILTYGTPSVLTTFSIGVLNIGLGFGSTIVVDLLRSRDICLVHGLWLVAFGRHVLRLWLLCGVLRDFDFSPLYHDPWSFTCYVVSPGVLHAMCFSPFSAVWSFTCLWFLLWPR